MILFGFYQTSKPESNGMDMLWVLQEETIPHIHSYIYIQKTFYSLIKQRFLMMSIFIYVIVFYYILYYIITICYTFLLRI